MPEGLFTPGPMQRSSASFLIGVRPGKSEKEKVKGRVAILGLRFLASSYCAENQRTTVHIPPITSTFLLPDSNVYFRPPTSAHAKNSRVPRIPSIPRQRCGEVVNDEEKVVVAVAVSRQHVPGFSLSDCYAT